MTSIPPLLVAMAGGKPRPRYFRAAVPKEIALHVAVAKLLRQHCLWEWTHINRTAPNARQGAIFKTMGVNPGYGDFILLSPNGWRAHFLELKRLGEVVDDDSPQGQFRIRALKAGAPFVVAWTMDQVLTTLDCWGCLRIKISDSVRRAGNRPSGK